MHLLAFFQETGATAVPGWASLGVGGAIACLLLYFYRQDHTENRAALIKSNEENRAALLERTEAYHSLGERLNVTLNNVTKVSTELQGAVSALKDSIDRSERWDGRDRRDREKKRL